MASSAPYAPGKAMDADYAYRIFVGKLEWVKVLGALVAETDYDNFKTAVARHQDASGNAYEHSLHEVWSLMYRLQH